MKRLMLGVAAVAFIAAVIFIAVLMLSGGNKATENSADAVLAGSNDTVSTESTESTEDGQLGKLLEESVRIIKSGEYRLTVTRQKQIGGLSVPVTTVSCYVNGIISILQYEGHDIMSEVFVNADGAYYLNADLKTAYLLPKDTAEAFKIEYEGLKYIESGSTNAGTSAYSYERYITPSGQTVDYLFSGSSLEKMKLYTGDEYELISVNISTDVSGARRTLPEDISIINE